MLGVSGLRMKGFGLKGLEASGFKGVGGYLGPGVGGLGLQGLRFWGLSRAWGWGFWGLGLQGLRFRVDCLGVYGFQASIELLGGALQGDLELCIDYASAGLHMVFLTFHGLGLDFLQVLQVPVEGESASCSRGQSFSCKCQRSYRDRCD